MFRYSYYDNQVLSVQVDGLNRPGFFKPAGGYENLYYTSTDNSGVSFEWDGSSESASIESSLFNLVGSDKYANSIWANQDGQFYIGSHDIQFCASDASNSLYSYTLSGGLDTEASEFIAVAGIVVVGSMVYWVDPCTKTLWGAERITEQLGETSDVLPFIFTIQQLISLYFLVAVENPQAVFAFNDEGVTPLGVAADTNGHLYVAGYQGGVIYVIDPVYVLCVTI